MKLTKRGKDFLAGILAGTIAASLLDIRVMLALCLTLVFCGIISMVILTRSSVEGAEIECTEPHVSCFKNQETKIAFRLISKRQRYTTVKISRLIPSRSIDTEIVSSDETMMSVSVTPRFAGRSSGLPVRFEIGDPLGFFSKQASFQLPNFIIDCIPSSILKEVKPIQTVYTSVGEREGRIQGLGLEFYSVDEYKGVSEAKDIFWKKVAAQPDERLLVKLHVKNTHKKILVSIFQTTLRENEHVEWMDSVCEGIALLGKAILQTGSDVELLFEHDGKVDSILISDLAQLSEGIMELSMSEISTLENAAMLIDKSDICVTGFKELQEISVAVAVAKKPALLIPDAWTSPSRVGEIVVIYDENQDCRELVSKVVGK
ncbi:MAG: hypothetical protein JRN15_15960 [Nitrososphaerota archaeon]|nr:hypothetical protein [Nitrososphaerota archaeon]